MASFALSGPLSGSLWRFLGPIWVLPGPRRASLGRPWCFLGLLWALPGGRGASLGPLWRLCVPFWCLLGVSGVPLGASWTLLGSLLEPLGSHGELLRTLWSISWGGLGSPWRSNGITWASLWAHLGSCGRAWVRFWVSGPCLWALRDPLWIPCGLRLTHSLCFELLVASVATSCAAGSQIVCPQAS